MSPQAAQQSVLAVVLIGGAVVVWDNIKRTGKASGGGGKQLVAFAILAAGLAILAGTVPQIGGPLAILIGLAIVVSRVGVKKA